MRKRQDIRSLRKLYIGEKGGFLKECDFNGDEISTCSRGIAYVTSLKASVGEKGGFLEEYDISGGEISTCIRGIASVTSLKARVA